MGSWASRNNSANSAQEKKNQEIDNQLLQEKRESLLSPKLLLLGAADGGKSTIVKQMRILHDNGFGTYELEHYRGIVYSSIIQNMCRMIEAKRESGIVGNDSYFKRDSKIIIEASKNSHDYDRFSVEVYDALKRLWDDSGIQQCYEQRTEYHLPDSTKHFMDSIDRIAAEDYIPNNLDMLYVRVPTNGIVSIEFKFKKYNFRIFDVAGQRSGRRKWIHCFDNVTAIIFICAMSEYDQTLVEDNKTNRMQESLLLFKQICNNTLFRNDVSMILFLNKKDIFAEKIKNQSIRVCFTDYEGANTYNDQAAYIQQRFEATNQRVGKRIYTHQTCATDTGQVAVVLNSVLDTVLRLNSKRSGISA